MRCKLIFWWTVYISNDQRFSIHCSNALPHISVDHRFSIYCIDALSYISVDHRFSIHFSNALSYISVNHRCAVHRSHALSYIFLYCRSVFTAVMPCRIFPLIKGLPFTAVTPH
jgi:hypothetical protein